MANSIYYIDLGNDGSAISVELYETASGNREWIFCRDRTPIRKIDHGFLESQLVAKIVALQAELNIRKDLDDARDRNAPE